MFSLICKSFPRLRYPARSPLTVIIKLYGTKSEKSLERAKKKDSFTFSYLVDKCGFAPARALSASNYIKFETPDRPESVISFLKSQGFTESQILKVVQRCPPILLCDPQNTLLPKIEFFKSLGFTVEDYTAILCGGPIIFKRSLENQLFPALDFLKKFFDCPEKIRVCMTRCDWVFSTPCRVMIEDNIELLRGMDVPEPNILQYLQNQPRLFIKDKSEFIDMVEEIKGMGFDPTSKRFMVAAHVISSMTKLTWGKKMHLFEKWDLSEDQILEAFGKNPWIMACSEDKILQGMDFFINNFGFKSADILRNPVMVMLSLKKRIIPRCYVFQTLAGKGLLKNDLKLLTRMLIASEERFVSKFVKCFESKVPDLLKLYQTYGSNAKVDIA
ncbi:unnamed protein product [Cuscuta epithymum]|uniref:Uncharacterized protein n=1 Tax=Cuscuta epithymum TaxID=186058 RepID=A0AAV0CW07_9ASTE|nr:unnamed protein product [Cuscuta epithymum]